MGKTEFSHDNCLKFSLQPLRALRSKDIEGLNFQILTSNFLLKLVQSSAFFSNSVRSEIVLPFSAFSKEFLEKIWLLNHILISFRSYQSLSVFKKEMPN